MEECLTRCFPRMCDGPKKGLESPEQFGRVERRGGTLKQMTTKGIEDMHTAGKDTTDMILSECLNAANKMRTHGGFAPAQWHSGTC